MPDAVFERLTELEPIARQLEPSPEDRAVLAGRVVDYANSFLDRLRDLPAFVATAGPIAGIPAASIGETPLGIDEALQLLARHVDEPGLNPASHGHLGYIPGGGLFHAALGDYLADVTNRYAGVSFASPGAVRLEHLLVEWMASVAGYPADAAGTLTSGGSLANLVGIVTARDKHGVTGREVERAVVYLTGHAHHSVDKALRIAGLGGCVVRRVPMDARYRMDAAALEALASADASAGLLPWLVVASAGSTDAGAIDPLDAVADIAERYGLWLHVDGAYGAFFALCDEARPRLAGMARSDSLVMDPHKGLFLPYGSGAVLVKDRRAMLDAHHYSASYMQDAAAPGVEPSPADLSPELSRPFRGLRMWLPLALLGLAPFRAALEEKLLLARYFHERIQRVPGFDVGPEPDLSVVMFRYRPARGDADAFNAALVRAIHADGRVFLSSSRIGGHFVLRLAVLSFRTHRDTIDLALEVLRDTVARLEAS